MRRFTSITLLCTGLGAPLAAQSTEGFPRAEIFADAILEFVEVECGPSAVADQSINAEIRAALEGPLGLSDLAEEENQGSRQQLFYHVEAMGKNLVSHEMTSKDKHGVAAAVVGAYGVLQTLNYFNAVQDDQALSEDGYLLNEAILQHKASVSLQLLECLWGMANETSISSAQSAFGSQGDIMWRDLVNTIHTSNCEVEFLRLANEYVRTDFSRVDLEERLDFIDATKAEHETYIESMRQRSECEDLI